MAKGFNKSGLEILGWEMFRGSGRQLGRDLTKELTRQVKKKVLDNDSPHRKLVNRFTLPGTFKGATNKAYTLIDSFYNEYVTTNAMFQSSFYMQSDIDFIERKLDFISRMIFSEAEERAYSRLIDLWSDYKQQALNISK